MAAIEYLTVDHLSTKDLIRIFSKICIHPDLRHNGTPCWIWTNCRQAQGYGHTSYRGNRAIKVHRLMFAWLVHPLPHGRKHGEIDHLCRRTSCCNPIHLEFVTTQVNVRRMKFLQTHCIRGHLLAGENLIPRKNKVRFCVICDRIRHHNAWLRLSPEKQKVRAERRRKWRETNKEQARIQRREYYEKNKEKSFENTRRWREANREHVNTKARIYNAARRARIKEQKLCRPSTNQ